MLNQTHTMSVGSFTKEYNHNLEDASLNGFSRSLVDNLVKKHSRKKIQNLDTTLYRQNNGTLSDKLREVFCYVPGGMSGLKKRLKYYDIAPVYSNYHKIKNNFTSTKDKIGDNLKSGIYAVECDVCKRRYIGQTKRSIAVRYKEHCACAKKNKVRQSAFAAHAVMNKHGTNENDHSVSLIEHVSKTNRLDAYESFFIGKETAPLNAESEIINSELFALV